MKKLINISELSQILGLIDEKTKRPNNYTLRYWEKEFKKIKPIFLRGRRYYSDELIDFIKLIKYLLKDKGLTIKGVKRILKSDINNLDDYNSFSLKTSYHKENIKIKSKKILNKLKEIKNYGKKNSH